jgi:hypothetical protein
MPGDVRSLCTMCTMCHAGACKEYSHQVQKFCCLMKFSYLRVEGRVGDQVMCLSAAHNTGSGNVKTECDTRSCRWQRLSLIDVPLTKLVNVALLALLALRKRSCALRRRRRNHYQKVKLSAYVRFQNIIVCVYLKKYSCEFSVNSYIGIPSLCPSHLQLLGERGSRSRQVKR